MKNLSLSTLLGLTLLAVTSCEGDGGDGPPVGGGRPQETAWKTVVDKLPFPVSSDAAVGSINIGRIDYNGNFANRGDVEVYFDQDAEVISIEMRYYDFSDDATAKGDDAQGIEGTFERMSLWAFKSTGNPTPPGEQKPEDDCTVGAWKSGCRVYVYYDGQVQPVRAGADIRVHLPKAYRGELNIVTEDNTAERTYQRLGNVTVDGLCSSGTIDLAQGEAKVKMCRELTPAPRCTADQIADCENYVEDGKPAAWASTCACPAEQFGQLRIESVKPWAGNITVDIPTTTWLNANLANEETDKPHECKPKLESCTEGICSLTSNDGSGYSISGEFNYPGTAAPKGAGFNLTVKSAGCNPVTYFPDEKAWNEDETLSKPKVEEHGFIKVCTDCL